MTQNKNAPHILVIYGPTGVGKTDFALEIASRIPAEIINMDVGQFYTPLSIGTAKPDWKASPIPHHLFDVIDKPENFTVTDYRRICTQLIQDIWNRGKLPILVGGSGFYLKSLFFPPLELESNVWSESGSGFDIAPDKQDTEPDFLGRAAEMPTPALWDHLYGLDPVRAQELNKNDRYRIMRALTIFYSSGKKPSDCKPIYAPIYAATIIFLTRDRKELYQRIDTRVELMMEHGWIAETQELLGTPWEQFVLKKKLIGYNEIIELLRDQNFSRQLRDSGHSSICGENGDNKSWQAEQWRHIVAAIQQRTRHYAKRQHTFWNMLLKLFEANKEKIKEEKEIKTDTVNLTLIPGDLYINRLISTLTPLLKKKEQP